MTRFGVKRACDVRTRCFEGLKADNMDENSQKEAFSSVLSPKIDMFIDSKRVLAMEVTVSTLSGDSWSFETSNWTVRDLKDWPIGAFKGEICTISASTTSKTA